MKNPSEYLGENYIPRVWIVSLIAASLGLLGFYFSSAEVGALIFTAIFIAWYSIETSKLVKVTKSQVMATEKYTKYSVMPNCYFTMKGDVFKVTNNSKFTIFFAVDILLVGIEENGNEIKVPQNGYWSKPLFVFGERTLENAPDFLKLDEFRKIPNFTQKGKIIAHIKYCYWPAFAPEEKSEEIIDKYWSFDFLENKWTGPNGAKFD